MKSLRLEPFAGVPHADLDLPGSKSHTNRALVCAALADGVTTLERFLFSDDTEAMLTTIQDLGFVTKVDRDLQSVQIAGQAGAVQRFDGQLNVDKSGTTGRFILPLLAVGEGTYNVDGHEQLRSRPMGPLVTALQSLGVQIEGDSLPLAIEGGLVTGDRVAIGGSVSSQFISALMLAAPAFPAGLTIAITEDPVSKPYIDLTAETMKKFGVSSEIDADYRSIEIAPQPYIACPALELEPDASAASYFFAAAAITGGTVRVRGLDKKTIQGDMAFVDILEKMGATVSYGEGWTQVQGPETLQGIDVDMRDCSDTAQTLAIVATFAATPTEVTGIGFIRKKETDRVAAVVTELQRLGVKAEETVDGFIIHPGKPADNAQPIATYEDHRMAMSFSLLGLVHPNIEILDPGCVSKTFPNFFDKLEELR